MRIHFHKGFTSGKRVGKVVSESHADPEIGYKIPDNSLLANLSLVIFLGKNMILLNLPFILIQQLNGDVYPVCGEIHNPELNICKYL